MEEGDAFVVTEMSQPRAERFNAPVAEEIAQMAVKVGATGIIAPDMQPPIRSTRLLQRYLFIVRLSWHS